MVKYQKWISKHIKKSLQNKTIFITGGNSGIGFEATRNFVSLGCNIIWGCRNIEKAEVAKAKIVKEFALANINIIKLDLSDVKIIEECAIILSEKYPKIDVIYNNAGVFRIPRGKTKQNLELVIGTNLVGTYYLNKLLLDRYPNSQFIFTSSITALFNKIDFDDPFFEHRKYGNFKAYGGSKFGINQMVTYWSKNFENLNVRFSIVHPGITYTPLINKAYKSRIFSSLASFFMKLIFHTAEKASLTAVLAVSDELQLSYYGPRGPFAISGYPKKRRIMKRYYKNNEKIINFLEGIKFEN